MGVISVRLKDYEEKKIRRAAEFERQNISQYCRDVLMNENSTEPINRIKLEDEMESLRAAVELQNRMTMTLFKLIFINENKFMEFQKLFVEGATKTTTEQIEEAEELAVRKANELLDDLHLE